MHIFVYPSKDSTIYNDFTKQNTGKDEIIEITKTYVSSSIFSEPYYSRGLLQFDLDWISQSIEAGTAGIEKVYLNLKMAWANELVDDPVNLYLYPVSQSWVEGFGKRLGKTIPTTGVTWIYRDSEVTSSWNASGSDYITGSYVVTASMLENENTFQESGNYIYELSDIRVEVTDTVKEWLSGSLNNYGFLIKRSDSEEQDIKNRGKINFYSMNSHTINIPSLEFVWDDSSYVTSSTSTETQLDDAFVYIKGLKEKYNNRAKTRIHIGSRDAYPTRSYATSNPYTIAKHLPSQSYYSLVDASTEETLIPFGEYSKISCDSNGNYFNLRLDGLFPERYYKLKLKCVSGSIEEIYDDNYTFKVTR